MSGVQVGTVSDMQLAPDGKSVTITLRIYRQYQIHKDARFVIEQSGFLGDQYVAILPTQNEGPIVRPRRARPRPKRRWTSRKWPARPPASCSTSTAAATNINDALSDARRTILSARALTNLSATLRQLPPRFRAFPGHRGQPGCAGRNQPPGHRRLGQQPALLLRADQPVRQRRAASCWPPTRPEIEAAVKNIESSTATLKNLLEGVQAGQGFGREIA